MASIYSSNNKLYLNIRVDGRRIRKATGLDDTANNRKKVQRDLPTLVMKLKMGEISFDKPRDLTVGYYTDVFLDIIRKQNKPRTLKQYTGIAKTIVDQFGSRQISDVKVSDVKGWLADLLAEKTGKTVRNYMIVFRNIFQEAIFDEVIDKNPFTYVRTPRKEKSDFRPFTKEEVTQLLDNAQGWFKNMVAVLAYTGMRTGEILALKWSDIDFENGEIHVQRAMSEFGIGDTKTVNSKRYIPVFESLKPYLYDQQKITAQHSEFVFLNQYKLPYRDTMVISSNLWRPLLEKCELETRRLYDLRHTFATNMLSSGQFPAMQISRWMGHTRRKCCLQRMQDI